MDIKQIQELVKLINKTSIGEITIEEDGTKITIKQKKEPSQKIYTQAPVSNYSNAPAVPAAAPPATTPLSSPQIGRAHV